MKSILIVCVNYNSYDCLTDYLASIDAAALRVKDSFRVVVAVMDNTETNYQEVSGTYDNLELKVFDLHKNLGYMGGATKVLEELGKDYVASFDFTIVSNVDITLADSFFDNLLQIEVDGVGWICPSILRTRFNLSDENPFLLKKLPKSKYDALIWMHSHPRIHSLYAWLRRKKPKNAPNSNPCRVQKEIYAGMGALFLFTKRFVSEYYPLTYPCYMYAEELYYAEMVQQMGLKTIYDNSLLVYDVGGVSTSQLGAKNKCKINRDSMLKLRPILYK